MYNLEVTDTFGGESNYSWVRRSVAQVDGKRAVIKAARELAGWPTSVRLQVSSFGDDLEIRPRGLCQVAFVTWVDD